MQTFFQLMSQQDDYLRFEKPREVIPDYMEVI